jgi:transcriptional regulator NrdR family protein
MERDATGAECEYCASRQTTLLDTRTERQGHVTTVQTYECRDCGQKFGDYW